MSAKKARAIEMAYKPAGALGSGARFAAVAARAKAGGAKNPEAVAASVGRAKYGKEKFQALAAAAKRRVGKK